MTEAVCCRRNRVGQQTDSNDSTTLDQNRVQISDHSDWSTWKIPMTWLKTEYISIHDLWYMFVRSICGYMWNGIIMLLVVVLSYYLGVQVKHIISAASCWHTLFKIISNQVLSHLFPKTLTSARTSTLLRSIPEMYLMSPHSLQAPASTYSSSNSDRTLTPPCPGPDNSTSQSAPLLNRQNNNTWWAITKAAFFNQTFALLLSWWSYFIT